MLRAPEGGRGAALGSGLLLNFTTEPLDQTNSRTQEKSQKILNPLWIPVPWRKRVLCRERWVVAWGGCTNAHLWLANEKKKKHISDPTSAAGVNLLIETASELPCWNQQEW